MAKILILDDEKSICKTLELYFSSKHEVSSANDIKTFETLYSQFTPDLLFIDVKLPDGNGLNLLKKIRQQDADIPVIVITGHSEMENPIEAMRMGASDFIQKPLDIEEVDVAVNRILKQVSSPQSFLTLNPQVPFSETKIVGHSKTVIEVLKKIGLVSQGQVNVLVNGDSGTGKELVAKNIHLYSKPEQPFIAINCSALPPGLVESELFGHEKGAFTHAVEKRCGYLELAKSGTLFLDEIGELPLDLQAKLLRVIQEKVFQRVGGSKNISFSARIVSATNRNLKEMIVQGSFREDLYFRLCTDTIVVPPLQDRLEDIPELVEHLLAKINRELGKKIQKVPETVIKALQNYSWPGNIRELENVLYRSALLSSGEIFTLAPFLPQTQQTSSRPLVLQTLSEVEKEHIERILEHTNGNISQASNILGISRPTLRKKIADYGLSSK